MGARFGGHVWEQRHGLWALARLASGLARGDHLPSVPGPELQREVAAPSLALQRDFVKFCGGDPAHYRSVIPPHMLSQWSLPLMLEVAQELPYPPLKVINTGVHVEFLCPLPQAKRLPVRAQLVALEEQERAVRVVLRVSTLLPSGEEAVRASLAMRVRKPRPRTEAPAPRKRAPADAPRLVPGEARELARYRLHASAGLEYSRLTGDYNPIHWSAGYARSTGLPGAVLQGFASFGLMFEALNQGLLSGDARAIAALDVQFLQPLELPAEVGVYWVNSGVSLATAPLAPMAAFAEVQLRHPNER
jgi:acyl dehydratase